MKQVIVILLLLSLNATAQTKNKSTTKTEATPQSPLSTEYAGRYAKDFANKMYYTRPVYGDKRQGLNVQIIDWMSKQLSDGSWHYMIKLNLTWEEGTGGWGDWKKVSYKGTMIADQFGCNAFYLIDEKEEPSILGILKRAVKLPEDVQKQAQAAEDWTSNAKYFWEPEGCLD